MKNIIAALFFLLAAAAARGQGTLTISECYALAEANYPLVGQRELVEKTGSFSLENASKGYLPQLSIGGQATYQSDVTQIPVEMPGVQPLSKDQYRVFAEISQTLYHGGLVRQQKVLEETNAATEAQVLEVDLYQLRQRVNDLFFGILLLAEQATQGRLVKEDLASALRKVDAGIGHGTALPVDADVLHAELLRVDQKIIEAETAEESFREILGIFINRPLGKNTVLEKPQWTVGEGENNRPELRLFDVRKQGIESSLGLLSARKKPRIELFLQGGYGRPALNMLDNSFDLYYVGGIRFNWMLSGFYTWRREKAILALRRQSLDIQRETFLFNTRLSSAQFDAEIDRLQRLIGVDDQIMALREKVRQTASVQLGEGVISATDYIREVNAADQARQNRVLHETQLLAALAKHRFTTGHP